MSNYEKITKVKFYTLLIEILHLFNKILLKSVHKNVEMWITRVVFPHLDHSFPL